MLTFLLICGAVAATVVASLLPSVLRQSAAEGTIDHRGLHAERLEELHRDHTDGLISAAALSGAEDELRSALLEESSIDETTNRDAIAPRRSALFVLLSVPFIAIACYWQLGQPHLIDGTNAPSETAATLDQATVDEMITGLKERLAQEPDSIEGWLLLGRSYMALGNYAEAVPALAKAHELSGESTQVMLQYADAIAMSNEGRLDPTARALVERVVVLEPNNLAALWLAGLANAQMGETVKALEYLHRARELNANDGETSAQLDMIIAGLSEGDSETQAQAPPGAANINVNVEISAELKGTLNPEHSVFVFARDPTQSGPPLAVMRFSAAELPRQVVLDESMAMAPMFKLKAGMSVVVTARVSASGQAAAAPGDWEGRSDLLIVGEASGVSLTIDEILK